MLGLVRILSEDRYVSVKTGTLAKGVKLILTYVTTTFALMEELVLHLEEDVSHVVVQLDILEPLVLFACSHFVPALFLVVKRRLLMENVM